MNWLIVVGALIVHVLPPAVAAVRYSQMPYKSKAQAAYFNENRQKLEAEGVNVSEWNAASKGKKLPKKAPKAKKGSK